MTNNYDTPDWTSLERLLSSDELCGHFMWMNDALLEDGDVLNAYKHRWTRRYFHLTADARTFNYVGDDTYCEVDPYVAIKAVFAGWEAMLAACECQPTPEERRALRAALRRAKARRESA
ncbi:MAG: hypothetical protein FWD04_03915 [Conexibacteraceae bacterium]|nr:hypothetical protein [Conexibacteraceae bacterium]